MHKLLVLYPTPESPDHFREYYVNKHLPLAKQLPGLRASRYSFSVEGEGEVSPYFFVWEGEFASAEDLANAMVSQIGQQVAADTSNYASNGVMVLHYSPIDTK